MGTRSAQSKAPRPPTVKPGVSRADRTAAGVNPAAKAANRVRLRRARGQVEGIERMLEGDRYCADIINQITAARASLLAVANDLLKRHLQDCQTAALAKGGGGADVDGMYQELMTLVTRMAR